MRFVQDRMSSKAFPSMQGGGFVTALGQDAPQTLMCLRKIGIDVKRGLELLACAVDIFALKQQITKIDSSGSIAGMTPHRLLPSGACGCPVAGGIGEASKTVQSLEQRRISSKYGEPHIRRGLVFSVPVQAAGPLQRCLDRQRRLHGFSGWNCPCGALTKP